MSQLLKLIADKNLSSFEEITTFLSHPPYCIEVREDKPVSNLYLLINTENSDLTNDVVRECNGIILDKNTNKIVAYGIDTLVEYEKENIESENFKFYEGYDGPLIKVYYYNAQWNISTTKCINGFKSRWVSNRSFGELFLDSGIDLETLDKNVCYSYVLEHPENRCVKPVYIPVVHLIASRDMTSFELTRYGKCIEIAHESDVLEYFKKLPYYQGVIIAHDYKNDITYKIFSQNYNDVKEVRGNIPDIRKRYLELMNTEKLNSLVSYYPEYQAIYMQIEQDLLYMAKQIQNIYYKKYVKKEDIKYNHKYEKTLKQLHAQYLKTKKINNVRSVHQRLLQVPGSALYWMLYA